MNAGRRGRFGRLVAGGAVYAVLIAVGAQFTLPCGAVPLSLQSLFVVLVGLHLGRVGGLLAGSTYVLLGVVGLPVFAAGNRGWRVLLGPSGGYLIGFALGAWTCGALAGSGRRSWWMVLPRWFAAALAGHLVILACGTVWIMLRGGQPLAAVWSVAAQPFLAGAVVKSVLAAVIMLCGRWWRGGTEAAK